MRMTFQSWVLLFLLSIPWGGSFFFVAIAVREIPPLTLVALRTGIAALTLMVLLRMLGQALPVAKDAVAPFFVMGFLNNLLPFSLPFWAQTMIPSGLASILNATTPIFSIAIAHFLLVDEHMAANKAVGIVLGFLGVVVLLGGDFFNGVVTSLGMVACLVASVSYGFAGVYGRRFKAMELSATQVAFGQLVATTLMMIPIISVIDMPWSLPMPNPPTIAAILALAIVSTALAYVIFFQILASAGAVNAALVTLLVPVSAILLGTGVLGEYLAPRHYAGMAVIGVGLLAIDGRLLNLWRSAPAPPKT